MKSKWKKVSLICGVIGLCCIVAAGAFAVYNLYDDTRAANAVKAETEQLESIVLSPERTREIASAQILVQPAAEPTAALPTVSPAPNEPDPDLTPEPTPEPTPIPTPVPDRMPVVTIDGSDFVAIISIPTLDLEFAVRNEWSKPGLKQSPCRYVGSVYTDDLIICAHNYTAHFGRLKELKQGDQIILVDMNGEVYLYHIDYIEEIDKFDISGMVSSGYDLTLFTCTIGGKARVTARCIRDA